MNTLRHWVQSLTMKTRTILLFLVVFFSLLPLDGVARGDDAAEIADDRVERLRLYAACRHRDDELKALGGGGAVDPNLRFVKVDYEDEKGMRSEEDYDCNRVEMPDFATPKERALFDSILADESCLVMAGSDAKHLEEKAEGEEEACPDCTPEEQKKSELGSPDCYAGITCSMLKAATLDPILGEQIKKLGEKAAGVKCTGSEKNCLAESLKGILKSLWETVYAFYDIPAQVVKGIGKGIEYVNEKGVVQSFMDVNQKKEDLEDSVAGFAVYMARKQKAKLEDIGDKLGVNEAVRKAQSSVNELQGLLETKLAEFDAEAGRQIKEAQTRVRELEGVISTAQAEIDSIEEQAVNKLKEWTPSILHGQIDRQQALNRFLRGALAGQYKAATRALDSALERVGEAREGVKQLQSNLDAARTKLYANLKQAVADAKARMPGAVQYAEKRIRNVNDMARKLDDTQLFEILNDPTRFIKEFGPQIIDTIWQLAASEFGCKDSGVQLEGIAPCKNPLPGFACATCAQKTGVFCQFGGYLTSEITIAVVTAILTAGTVTAAKYAAQGASKVFQLASKMPKVVKILKNSSTIGRTMVKGFLKVRKITKKIAAIMKKGGGAWRRAVVRAKRFLKDRPVIGKVIKGINKVEDKGVSVAKKVGILEKGKPITQGAARRAMRSWYRKRLLQVGGAGFIGFLVHQSLVTPQPQSTLDKRDAKDFDENGEKQPEELPKMSHIEALEKIPGLGWLGSRLGTTFLEDLAALGENDHIVIGGADPLAISQYLDLNLPPDFLKAEGLKGTPALAALERIYRQHGKDGAARPPEKRARVTALVDDEVRFAPHLKDRVKTMRDQQILMRENDLAIPFQENGTDKRTKAKMIVDIGGPISRSDDRNPLTIFSKYLGALDDDGTIWLSAKELDERTVKVKVVDEKTQEETEEEWTLRTLLTHHSALEVTEPFIQGVKEQPVRVKIRPAFRGAEKRRELISYFATKKAE